MWEMLEKKLDRISPGKWRNQICLEKVEEKKTSANSLCGDEYFIWESVQNHQL